MKPGVVVAALLAMFVSIFFVIELVRPPTLSTAQNAIKDLAKTSDEAGPPVSKTGPYPKAVIAETDYEFGRMEVGEERSHTFTIRNEGEAPLILKKGKSTCQCTMSDLEVTVLPVGASTTVTLTWKPTSNGDKFEKGATILTNEPRRDADGNPLVGDGNNPPPANEFMLRAVGMVVARLMTIPADQWDVAELADETPTVVTGMVVSPLVDKFQIVALECKSPFVTAESVPLDKETLDENSALSGYQIRVTISPGVPIGTFTYPLKIKTDIPGRDANGVLGKEIESEVLISGQRRGPVRFLGSPGEWAEENMSVTLGSFNASAGKKATLRMRVRAALATGFELTGPPECEPAGLKATLVPDDKAQGKPGYFLLNLEYPPDAPPAARRRNNPAKVTLRTNHPEIGEIVLLVYFAAL